MHLLFYALPGYVGAGVGHEHAMCISMSWDWGTCGTVAPQQLCLHVNFVTGSPQHCSLCLWHRDRGVGPAMVVRPYIINAVKRYLSYHGMLSLMYKVSFKIRGSRVDSESRDCSLQTRESSLQPPTVGLEARDSRLQTLTGLHTNSCSIQTSDGTRAINKSLPRLIPRHET